MGSALPHKGIAEGVYTACVVRREGGGGARVITAPHRHLKALKGGKSTPPDRNTHKPFNKLGVEPPHRPARGGFVEGPCIGSFTKPQLEVTPRSVISGGGCWPHTRRPRKGCAPLAFASRRPLAPDLNIGFSCRRGPRSTTDRGGEGLQRPEPPTLPTIRYTRGRQNHRRSPR